jgi:ankyrin repeat protein
MRQPPELLGDQPLLWSTGTGVEVWTMLTAAAAGDLPAVQRLVERKPELAHCQHAYRTPLYFAVRENHLAVASYLLSQGTHPLSLGVFDSLLEIAADRGYQEMSDFLEQTLAQRHNASPQGNAIAEAIRARDLPQVKSLLDASPELLLAGDLRSNQPIHWAVMTRQLDLIDELLQRGADINARRSDGARPIQLTNGDYEYRGWRNVPSETTTTPDEVMAHLITRGAYVDICTAAALGDESRVRALLAEDPGLANRVSEYVTYYLCSGSPLRNAASRGHLEIVKLLLAHGADPNLREEGIAPLGAALHEAVAGGHLEVAHLLLRHGAHPNGPIESSGDCLSCAIRHENPAMIELLASYGSARSVEILAYYGDVQTAAAVFDANRSKADDLEAFSNAVDNGHESFVLLMLRYQPDVAARFFPPGAPTRELDEFLFSRGMNPSQRNWMEVTPLHRFAARGDLERAALFLDHGADIDARDEELRSTPLAWAAKHGQVAMTDFLLSRGARPNLPDDPPWATPLAWATRRGHGEVVDLLQRHGITA